MQLKLDYDSGEIKSKLDIAIQRYKTFEPEEGYYLAFSGGKDSIVIYEIAKMSGVKFDAHYNWTTVDPPELLYFIKKNYPEVTIHKPELSMWQLIEKKMIPPTRIARYCCSELKEKGGIGRFVVTGVRHAESSARSKRKDVEYDAYGSQSKKAKADREKFNLMNDNDEKRRMIEHCQIKGKNILNPIIDWEDKEVWQFIKSNNLKYCGLYDEGWSRIGCIGCPMAKKREKIKEFKRYPKHYINYIKAFDRMIKQRHLKERETQWKNGEEVMKWWLELSDREFEEMDKGIRSRV